MEERFQVTMPLNKQGGLDGRVVGSAGVVI